MRKLSQAFGWTSDEFVLQKIKSKQKKATKIVRNLTLFSILRVRLGQYLYQPTYKLSSVFELKLSPNL